MWVFENGEDVLYVFFQEIFRVRQSVGFVLENINFFLMKWDG